MLPGIRNGLLPRSGRQSVTCLLCQWRSFVATASRHTGKPPPPGAKEPAASPTEKQSSEQLANAPRSYGKRTEEFTPTPLSRPIGMPDPPQSGDHADSGSRWRDDITSMERNLARRAELKYKMLKPYFRDWSNLRFHQGKTFIAPPRPFRSDLSLYFPNLYGRTLKKNDRGTSDTTPVLEGKASVVTVFSGRWAENQVETFVSKRNNAPLHEVLDASKGRAQLVRINVEESTLKAWLVRMFMGSLRRRLGRENWGKYFLVRKGISDDIRECIGLLNSKVGYTYLVDSNCRIRWAGSGESHPEERTGLVKGVNRLLAEMDKEAPSTSALAQTK